MSWIAAASLLMIAAFADPVRRGGFIDFIMVGLALYELMIGTVETA